MSLLVCCRCQPVISVGAGKYAHLFKENMYALHSNLIKLNNNDARHHLPVPLPLTLIHSEPFFFLSLFCLVSVFTWVFNVRWVDYSAGLNKWETHNYTEKIITDCEFYFICRSIKIGFSCFHLRIHIHIHMCVYNILHV